MSNDDQPAHKRRRASVPAAERRRQIVLAAQQVFARTSLQGAKTRDLAKAANINQATLFEHFRSKEALFQAAVVEPMLEAMRGMRDRAHSYETAETLDELRRMARPSAQRHIDVMIKIFPLLTAALFSDLDAGKKLYREQLAPLLRQRAQAISGFVKPDLDPELVELIGFGSLFAIAMDRTLGDRPAEPATLLDQWLRLSTTGFALAHPALGRRPDVESKHRLGTRRRLGRSELELAPLTFSAASFAKSSTDAVKTLRLYFERGGNCIDIPNHDARADIESALGKHIASRREHLVLATHCSLSTQPAAESEPLRSRLLRDVEATLARLATESIDVLFLHGWDARVSTAELFAVIEDLRRSGKVRYVGLSQIPAWQAARLQTLAELNRAPLVAIQAPYNLFDRAAEGELLAMARELGLGVLPTSPLAHEVLTKRKHAKRPDAHRSAILSALNDISAEMDCTPTQVALAWTLLNPAIVSPVVDPRTPTVFEECCAALDLVLGAEQIERLDRASRPVQG